MHSIKWKCICSMRGTSDRHEMCVLKHFTSSPTPLNRCLRQKTVMSSQTTALMTSLCPLYKHEYSLLIGWNIVVWIGPNHIVYFYRINKHQSFVVVHTQSGQLADREKIFTEFDKKCIVSFQSL